ncbi:spartin a isoform X2 [Astyanax mexicanus]|uniref:spartin a isoform X2 n=1 Tax=Astyanax mexicanus TaxID=7994 RepID=UPI0020CAECA6|nr:spartin a isoform X2 [Astyanax mexicanus]
MEALEPAELQLIKNHYEKAYECLSMGLREDESGNKGRAVVLYRLGRRHLLQGLEVRTTGERCVGAVWESARQLQLKMNESLSNITTRLAVLETTTGPGATGAQALYPNLSFLLEPCRPASAKRPHANRRLSPTASGGVPYLPTSPNTASDVPSELPPAYTPQPTDGHLSLSPRPNQGPRQQSLTESGEDLLFLPHGVQIFFVTADGQVSTPLYPGYLRIFLNSKQNRDSSDCRHPPAYLQVCDWLYPLFPDSPVLLSNTGVFTFPDTTATVPGSCVGVVLSPELPAADRALFQEHLSVLTQLRVQPEDVESDEPTRMDTVNLSEKALNDSADETDLEQAKEEKVLPEWSEKMSQGILAGASWLSRGLVQGAEATGKAISKGATKLREHMTPEETPAEVNPRVTRGLQVAKQATGGAAKVSNFLVGGLSSVVELVGKELTPHVKKHSSKLIPESFKTNKEACANMGGAKAVAASSLKGLSTIWSGLETAAKTVGKSASSETVQTVKHKFRGLESILEPSSNM